VPAREGALGVLRASRDVGVKRAVLTSSFAEIGYGQKPWRAPFGATNWTSPWRGRRHRLREIEDSGQDQRRNHLGFLREAVMPDWRL